MACGCQSNIKYPVKLINVIQHDEEVYSFDFRNLGPLSWKEGDNSKLLLEKNGKVMSRKLSYASLKDEKVIRFTTRIRKEASSFKEVLAQMKIGSIVSVTAPSGHFALRRDGRPALLISNGVGIATMRPLIKAFEKDPTDIGRITQINVDRSSEIYKQEFDELVEKGLQFTSIYTKSRKEFYQKLDFEAQRLMFGTGIIPNVYIVGSDDFVMDLYFYMQNLGFAPEDLITDGVISGVSAGGCGCSSSGSSCACHCG